MPPLEVYSHTIAEINYFLIRRNLRQTETVVTLAWRVINFLGGFFSGKLRDLDSYLPETPARAEEVEEKKEALLDGLHKRGF